MTEPTEQRWSCDTCGATGTVKVEQGEGVWSVAKKIADDHAQASERCKTGIDKVRVLKEGGVDGDNLASRN